MSIMPILRAGLATLAICVATAVPAQTAGNTGILQQRIDSLEAEIVGLTAQIERLQFENRQLRDQVRLHLDDILFRLTELEGGDPSTLESVRLGTQPRPQAAPVILSEQADLDRAKGDIQQGRFDQGEDRLRDFVSRYPQSSLLSEANYWLGQSLFIRGAFPEAARVYLAGYNADETGSFAADNLFQLGVTLGRMKQIAPACQTLAEIKRQFPSAPAAIRDGATQEMAALGCL